MYEVWLSFVGLTITVELLCTTLVLADSIAMRYGLSTVWSLIMSEMEMEISRSALEALPLLPIVGFFMKEPLHP